MGNGSVEGLSCDRCNRATACSSSRGPWSQALATKKQNHPRLLHRHHHQTRPLAKTLPHPHHPSCESLFGDEERIERVLKGGSTQAENPRRPLHRRDLLLDILGTPEQKNRRTSQTVAWWEWLCLQSASLGKEQYHTLLAWQRAVPSQSTPAAQCRNQADPGARAMDENNIRRVTRCII